MPYTRPFVLSIAAFDPCGGAGVLADIKTFEAHKVYGMAVVTGLTFQNDTEFDEVHWLEPDAIIRQLDVLCRKFRFQYVKIGMIQNFDVLKCTIQRCRKYYEKCRIIWDPVMKASAGFRVHKNPDQKKLMEICRLIDLITPNISEARELGCVPDEMKAAVKLNGYCHVLLKGGHNDREKGTDFLFIKGKKIFTLKPKKVVHTTKHGTGCVLSSAITANLAQGYDLYTACSIAKEYIAGLLMSNYSSLGYHNI